MIYDVAIIGAGPAGLMAARTAASYGLKTVLFEKKREPGVINRACTALFYLKWVTPDAYLEPVTVEKMPDGARFHWPVLGLSVNYSGPLVPYSNAVWISPGGVKVYAFKNELFAYYFDKEVLIGDLLREATAAGAKIRAGVSGMAAENTRKSVRITIRNVIDGSVEDVEARWCVAADGVNSQIVESLGLNEKRRVFLPLVKGVSYVMEGVDCPIPESRNGHLTWMFPELEGGRFMLDPRDGDKWWVGKEWETLRHDPQYAPWFEKARVLKKAAFSATVRTPLREPVTGRVIAVGDAASPIETWVQGSLACGYRAAKAIIAELDGRRALDEYTRWWQHAFYFNDPGYFKRVIAHHLLSWNRVCSGEEIDYIYRLFENERVVPTLELARRPEILRKDRPELYRRVVKTYRELMDNARELLSVYPDDAAILHDPEAHLKRWPYFRL